MAGNGRNSSAMGFFASINPLALFDDAETLTPHEFLRDFYTRRGLYDKLKDVNALVQMYGHQMPLLYVELDKKYGTAFSKQPPPVLNEIRSSEPVHSSMLSSPRSPSANETAYTLSPSTPNSPSRRSVIKIVLLGNSGVGKTNLISRLHKGEFNDEFTSTVGVEFLTHAVQVDNVEVKAQIWDTAGQERFHAMMSTYYRKAAGALLIFDVGNRASLLDVERWLDQLLNVAEPGLHATLVGNKCDVPDEARAVTAEEARQFAAAHHMAYIETSAKTGFNVDVAFHDLVSAIHRARLADFSENSFSTIELTSTKRATSFFDCKLF